MNPAPKPTSTARFQYLPIETKDIHHFNALYRDPEVMAKIMQPLTEQQVSELFSSIHCETSNAHFFTIIDTQNSNVIGLMGFLPYLDKSNQLATAEFGIVLYPHCYRNGVAKESITRLLEFGFQTLCLDQAFAHFHKENNAIRRIAEYLSFSIEPHHSQSNKTTCKINRDMFITVNRKKLIMEKPNAKSSR